MPKKLIIAQIAALGPDQAPAGFRRMRSAFPAVTCTVQASVRTAQPASGHGMVANGLYFPELRKVLFWEQSSALVAGDRIWSGASRARTVAMMFWQQSLGEAADIVVSPAPVHKHGGGMIQDCYTKPRGLQQRLVDVIGHPFNLMHYWGPLASAKSTDWIVAATQSVMQREAPDVLFTYVPHLDYALQRHGPESKPAHEATATIARHITALKESAARDGYETIFYGDYAIEPVTSGACFPNRALAAAGLLETREIRGMQYPDFHASRAFAIADHAVAHVHVGNPQDLEDARAILESLPGVDLVLDPAAQTAFGLAHVRSGELVLVAKPGAWFAYPWWQAREQAPDFATHVDIHNKPGYDPCELFFGWPPLSVSMDTDRVKGTHGRLCEVAWDTSLDLGEPADHVALGAAIRNWLQRS